MKDKFMFSEVQHTSEDTAQSEKPEVTYVETLLFHGAKAEFQFSSEYTFDNPENDGSFTLGEGMYLTAKMDHALDYSEVRQRAKEYKPLVYSVSSENCKFLDFRGADGNNVPVPTEIVTQWRDCFKQDLARQISQKPDLGPERVEVAVPGSTTMRIKINREYMEREDLVLYLNYLDEVVQSSKPVEIRELLGTAPVREMKTTFTGNETAPPWSRLFRTFVTDQLHYDGLIALEGGEGNMKGLHASYVVYNLDAITVSQQPLARDTLT